jgi:hypothetical protein
MNYMPLIHHARYVMRARKEGNPFADEQSIADLQQQLSAAYVQCANPLMGLKLMDSINELEEDSQ